jgi:hypothetical protein
MAHHPIDMFSTDVSMAYTVLSMDIAQFLGKPQLVNQEQLNRAVDTYLARVAHAGERYHRSLEQ